MHAFALLQVRHCEICQRSKRKFDKPAAMLHPIPVSDVWNKIGIDLIKLPETPRGNNYLITIIDYFSKWAEAEPIPTKEAIHVANFLKKMIMRHGCPQEIISDQVTGLAVTVGHRTNSQQSCNVSGQ